MAQYSFVYCTHYNYHSIVELGRKCIWHKNANRLNCGRCTTAATLTVRDKVGGLVRASIWPKMLTIVFDISLNVSVWSMFMAKKKQNIVFENTRNVCYQFGREKKDTNFMVFPVLLHPPFYCCT